MTLIPGDSDTGFGVYLHVPFCAHRCDYCAFATWTDRSHLIEPYFAAMQLEIERAVDSGMDVAKSVFVGGGTPSLVDPQLLARAIECIPVLPGVEVTVECNPDTITSELLDTYIAAGVNRISMGVQSMDPETLRSLGRTHDPSNVVRAVDLVRRAGFTSFNVDLIYGAVVESVQSWRETMEATISLEPTHVSAYALTVESGTPLARDRARHPDNDDLADKYLLADELLVAAGFEWYEISNWARPGHECRHNQLYWDQGDYLGFGCAAHSHRSGHRWWNARLPERYIEAIERGESAEAAGEYLDADAQRMERLDLALRTAQGVPVSALSAEDRERFRDLIHVDGDRIVLNPRGRLLANEVIIALR